MARLLLPMRCVDPLHPGTDMPWIARSSHFRRRLCCSAAHGDTNSNMGRLLSRLNNARELPWELKVEGERKSPEVPQFGGSGPQRTPWDRGAVQKVNPLYNNNPWDREGDRNVPYDGTRVMHFDGEQRSSMASIVEKLRYLEHKNQVRNQQRNFSTTPGAEEQSDNWQEKNLFGSNRQINLNTTNTQRRISPMQPSENNGSTLLGSQTRNFRQTFAENHQIGNQQRRFHLVAFKEQRSFSSGLDSRPALFNQERNASSVGHMGSISRPDVPSLAELTIPTAELRRLQRLGFWVNNPIKIGYLGVTKSVIQTIHNRWQRCEVVKLKVDGPPAVNMTKTQEELELKTGGLVIWRAGGAALLYRGKGYFDRVPHVEVTRKKRAIQLEKDLIRCEEDFVPIKYPLQDFNRIEDHNNDQMPQWSTQEEGIVTEHVKGSEKVKLSDASTETEEESEKDVEKNTVKDNEGKEKREVEKFDLEKKYVDEVDALLEEIGPRYDDWVGAKPVPVDGDLLPPMQPGFKKPLRMLPFRVRSNLTDMELTVLRKLARPLPPHFVLGRNRGLQGLACGVLKLWEKSEIVKIGVKRGIQHTRNELMAEELKRLTGGVLLSRDKFFITMYRGKDFLPPAVAEILKEREVHGKTFMEAEEALRMRRGWGDNDVRPSVCGTLAEAKDAMAQWKKRRSEEEENKNRKKTVMAIRVREQKRLEKKLATALAKKKKAESEISKLEQSLKVSEPPKDRETISDEERYMFRKLGLKMDAYLLMGRRGIFDGVIENMHLHWKHRELVKLIFKEKDKQVAVEVAKMLEAESGGILVSVSTTSKGQAIIIYRGKNYQRPPVLRPRNLLTKRKALFRSQELQRRQALESHIKKLEEIIRTTKKDYDYMLKNCALPDSPRQALYKPDGLTNFQRWKDCDESDGHAMNNDTSGEEEADEDEETESETALYRDDISEEEELVGDGSDNGDGGDGEDADDWDLSSEEEEDEEIYDSDDPSTAGFK